MKKHSFKRIQIAGHPEGNPDIDKNGSMEKTINALKIKQEFAQRTKLQVGNNYSVLFLILTQ
ncbi:MAG: hypothetical protein ACJZ8S_02635 [Paracoccaceae bacterium]